MIVIGIDPGAETGLAKWDTRTGRLLAVQSSGIIPALRYVEENIAATPYLDGLLVIFEDARKRKWFGNRADLKTLKHGAGVREGVGSVKRDCSIWEEFLTAQSIPFEGRYPSKTKMNAEGFRLLTGWAGRTNEHARDAGMIVFGMNESIARAKVIAFKDAAASAGRAGGNRPEDRRSIARAAL